MSGLRYTPTEDAYITANWQTTTDADMAAALGRPANSVADRRHKLGFMRRDVPALREGRSYAGMPRPSRPSGITDAQAEEARTLPGDREAGLILVMYAEGRKMVAS